MNYNDEEFWLLNYKNLFKSSDILPVQNSSANTKLNTISRLSLFISLIVIAFDYNIALKIIVISFIIIIFAYYINNNNMITYKESFTCLPPTPVYQGEGGNGKIYTINQSNWKKNTIPLTKPGISGPPNPKTQNAPIVVAKSHDLDFWKANEFITHSHINEKLRIENYQSGYTVSGCVKSGLEEAYPPMLKSKYGTPIEDDTTVIEGYEYPYQETKPYDLTIVPNKTDGDLNDIGGYNPKRVLINRPTNLSSGVCTDSNTFSDYNKNLFTQIIQPGVYTKSDITEPINSNYGISFTQQFPQTTYTTTDNGELIYTEHDDRLSMPVAPRPNMNVIEDINNSNVYDPRSTGYGSNYRTYTERVTGQNRYMYDDINAIRMPNYITRNHIDFLPFGDSYGPMKDGQRDGNVDTGNIKKMAQSAWFDNTTTHRNEIQERLMRKRNAESWQQRVAPIRTSTSMGAMRKF